MITGSETTLLVGRPLPTLFEGKLPVISAHDAVTLGLRDDQIVRPLVTVQNEALKLHLLGMTFDAPPNIPLKEGSTLTLRVQMLANGGAILKPLEAAVQAAATVSPARIDRLLLMPNSLNALLQALRPASLLQMLAPAAAALPQVSQALELVQRTRPSMQTLDGAALKRAILNSGFLGEVLLAQKQVDPTDLKFLLRQLIEKLGPGHEASASKLDELLDDMEAFQVQTLQVDSGRAVPLHVVLSFRDAPPVEVSIHRERAGQDAQDSVWDVDLYMQSDELGGVWLRTRILGIDRVGLTMWMEREEVCALASQRGPLLRDALRQAQLNLIDFQVIHGARPDRVDTPSAPKSGSLIDCEA
ncbi:MAG: hypothetical protein RLZ63_81 [Pseudomonadota bacterium]|jgi:hypothetical protein